MSWPIKFMRNEDMKTLKSRSVITIYHSELYPKVANMAKTIFISYRVVDEK